MDPHHTLIRLEGRDALDLLHRISTQHLRELEPGHCGATSFCDFRGRLQHRAVVARTSDGAVWLARDDAPATGLIALIDAQIFRDDVRIEDRSGAWWVMAEPASDASPAGTIVERDAVPGILRLGGGVDLMLFANDDAPALPIASRIRLGFPTHGHEIREAFTPLEVGLARDVHLDKGCFTGQEALLRLVTYRSVRRRLVLLEGDGAAPSALDAIRANGEDLGVVTSVMPERDGWVALAVVKRDVLETGVPLVTESGAVTRVTPFEQTRPAGLPDLPATRT